VSIPAAFIQDLLARVDVVDVVGRYVALKKSGANFMGLCPFHGEKSPSFSVSPSKQFFHCFGCGKNGDAIAFLMEHSGLGFHEAVQTLANQAGLQVPDDGASPKERERAATRKQRQATLVDVLEQAAQAWQKQLRISPYAIDYLKRRGLSGQIAKRYGLGYAPEGPRALASVFPDYNHPLLHESGLVVENTTDGKRYDRFRERIMFPIRNVKGQCIGFGGRVLGDVKPKYLNSPETPVFHKGRELYGLYEARSAIRERGLALVTEGYMDVVALAQWGFPNTVATLGTACTPEHIHLLLRFTSTVVFSFDGDAAGQRAARKALDAVLPHASDTRTIKFLFLPAEHDPDSFIRAYGSDAFARHVGDALPLSRFLLEAVREHCDLGHAEGRAHMLANARPLWSGMPDGALKRQLLGELAALGQLPAAELTALWEQTPSTSEAQTPKAPQPAARNSRADTYRPQQARRWQTTPSQPAQAPLPRNTATARRHDHAARLLLSHMAFMEHLGHEELALLCALPAPHGPLFVWLEGQYHEHGSQSWAVLRTHLHIHPCGPLAEQLMQGEHAQLKGTEADLLKELRDLLGRMLIEHIKQQENALIAAAAQDPGALEHYRALQARRRTLETAKP